MIDEYMKKYHEQMDKITLSDTADQKILNDLLKAEAGKGEFYMKKPRKQMRAAMVAIIIIIISSATVACGTVIHSIIVRSQQIKSRTEENMATANIDNSTYYNLLAGNDGEIYALTSSDYDTPQIDQSVIVWKSSDQCNTWESVLIQPDPLDENSNSGPIAGDLREGESGIEAVIIADKYTADDDADYTRQVYQVTKDSYTEYNMDEVYTILGDQNNLFSVRYVNDHTLALVGYVNCLLYDTDTQKVVKELPYSLTMGGMECLLTQDQFLIYGKEIYTCLNADTLEDETPDPGLEEFIQAMYVNNGSDVLAPMYAQSDTITCIAATGIYEYCDGETKQIRELSTSAFGVGGYVLNGLLPACKGHDGEYYVCTFSDTGGISLWKIGSDVEKLK